MNCIRNAPRTHHLKLLTLAVAITALVKTFDDSATLAADRPNILFIFTDDHAPHAIGAYKGWLKDVNPTPNIDRLAEQGMLFQTAFAPTRFAGPAGP